MQTSYPSALTPFILFMVYAGTRTYFFFRTNKHEEYRRFSGLPVTCYLLPLLMVSFVGELYWTSYIFLVAVTAIGTKRGLKKLLASQNERKTAIKKSFQWFLLEMAVVFLASYLVVKFVLKVGYFTPDF